MSADTCNITGADDGHRHLHPVNIILISLSCVIFLVGVIGNILVIYVFRFVQRKRSVTENLIIYLAIGDFVGSVINPFVFIYMNLTLSQVWHFGHYGCKILPSLQKVTISFSIGILLMIAVYRCLMICRHASLFKLQSLVACVVLLSILIRLPYIMNLKVRCNIECVGQVENTHVTLYILVAEDLIFVVIFAITLFFIYRELYDSDSRKYLKNQLDLQRNKTVVFMLVVMAIIFLATVLPRHIFLIVIGFDGERMSFQKRRAKKEIESALELLFMCNSLCNPFIYGKLHTQFRTSVKKTMRAVSQRGRLLVSRSSRRGKPLNVKNREMYQIRSCPASSFVLKRPNLERQKSKEKMLLKNIRETYI